MNAIPSLRGSLQRSFCLVVVLVGAIPSVGFGQDSSEVRATYGRGVHAYFAGRSMDAEQFLTQAINSGSTDPRVYYFRAIVRLRMGRQGEAENDMRVGAAFEARDPGSQHAIGRALQRVQGPGRRTLERFRRDARLNRVQQRRSQSHNRYERLQQREPVVLHREAPVLLEQLVEPSLELGRPAVVPSVDSPAQPAVPALGDAVSPLPATPTPTPIQVPDELPGPAPEPAAEEDDLFGEPEADPFGEPSAEAESRDVAPEPAEPMPEGDPLETSPDPAPADDLFGESAEGADEEDPFGESAESETPDTSESEDDAGEPTDDAEDPFGETETSPDDDPFGESTESGESTEGMEEEEPVETEDAEEVNDLFGDAPAAVPAGEFGEAPSRTAMVQPEQFFFQLGRMFSSLSNPAAHFPPVDAPTATVRADFELGPADEFAAEPASAEQPMAEAEAAGDSEGDPEADDLFGADAAEVEAAPADATDDPFGAEPTAAIEEDPFEGF